MLSLFVVSISSSLISYKKRMIKFPAWRHKSPDKDWRVTGFPDDPSLVFTCLLFPETQEVWKEDRADGNRERGEEHRRQVNKRENSQKME